MYPHASILKIFVSRRKEIYYTNVIEDLARI